MNEEVYSIGISEKEAAARLAKFGSNTIEGKNRRSVFLIFLSQFYNFLIILLFLAFLVSILTSHFTQATVLGFIILLNVIMGFILEYKAEKALRSLKNIFSYKSIIIRGGKEIVCENRLIVPGDIILLNQGNMVPADLRLIETNNLEVDESTLTGESVPVPKIADQKNMAFSGTMVTKGFGKGIVVATGSKTEIGKIAESVEVEQKGSFLQKRLEYLGKILTIVSLLLVVIIFIFGFIKGFALVDLFNYSIALLVSAVPESLPTIITLTLALGVIKMAKNKSIVRKLSAVENLASVNVICCDKTGTLTKNEMTVKKLWTLGENEIDIEGTGYLPKPKIKLQGKGLRQLITVGYLCNKATLNFDEKKEKWNVIGDPTEGALLVLGKKGEIDKDTKEHKKLHEILFDEKRRLMSLIYTKKNKDFVYTKGSPETIINICSLVETDKTKIKKEVEKLASQGYRILALASKEINYEENLAEKEIEKNLNFLGLVGLIDSPAEGIKEAIKTCQKAQIKTIIISGDHKLTTLAIANEVGLDTKEENILTGEQLDQISETGLLKVIDKINVFARTSPIQKSKILAVLIKKGYRVAMTGDGINDAPALKKADVGIAMGGRGQDIAKEVSDIILVDDRFSTIEKAISFGRTIYDNMTKFTIYLVAGNFTEILLITLAFILEKPLPLTPLQILWINLITESGPAVALAFENPKKEIMEESPRNPNKDILKPVLKYAFSLALISVVLNWILYVIFLPIDIKLAQTMVFTMIVLSEVLIIFVIRSRKFFTFSSNKYLVFAVIITILLQGAAIYTPLSRSMETATLTASHWMVLLGLCLIGFAAYSFLSSLIRPQHQDLK